MIKYRFARGSDQSVVDIRNMDNHNRYEQAPYTCFGCGSELIPNLGQKKVKHFSHKSVGNCSRETYLHQLAKDAFSRKYIQSLNDGAPFIFRSSFPGVCNHYEKEIGETCNVKKSVDVDLTKHFKSIDIEKPYEGFVPDILLSSDDGSEVLFIEIAVTHKCEKEKINLGKRIIEIEISNESDVQQILDGTIRESSKIINTHNFNKKEIVGDICNGNCEREVNLFVIYKSEKSILLELTAKEALKPNIRGKISYRELIGFSTGEQESQIKMYKNKVREAHFKKIPIKNCYLCKYHGADGIENAIFCKFRKESFGSNEAVECQYYRTFRNIKECQVADKANEEYAKKNESRFITNAFMRLINRNLP